jgi:hypothetical protein
VLELALAVAAYVHADLHQAEKRPVAEIRAPASSEETRVHPHALGYWSGGSERAQ